MPANARELVYSMNLIKVVAGDGLNVALANVNIIIIIAKLL